MFYIEEIENKKILKTTLLDNLNHCFTTKDSFILSNDETLKEQLKENKKILCDYLKISEENLVCPIQTHSSNIKIAEPNLKTYPDTDALILTNKKQAIFLNFADCTPIILYDKKKNISAVVHAGWKGTVAKIVIKTINKMVDELNCATENIVAAIGPTISKCCFEIQEDVYKQLNSTINMSQQKENSFFIFKNHKIYADLKKINEFQILSTGVKDVEICQFCTCCNNNLFFSYRKENGTTSRHNAIIKLK